MTDEELIVELRKPWFTNGCELYQLTAADRIETLVKERDEARAAWELEATAVKRFAERHERHLILGAEVRARAERLEAALIQMRDDRTAFRHAVHFRRFITATLKGADHE